MEGIALLLAGAAVGYAIARWLSVPSTPLLLLGGFGLAATGALPVALLENALILGVTFLLFITGIELDPRRMRAQGRAAVRVGLLQFFLLAGAGLSTALLLGFGLLSSVYLALALTASSTLIAIRLLKRRRQMFEPFGRLVTGVLLVQDLLVILLIPVVTEMPAGPGAVLTGLVATTALLALTWAAHRRVAPLFPRLDGDDEALLLAALALLFVFIGLADALELPLVVGAFLAGVALSGFPVSGLVRSQLNSIGDFFSALFFTALGALIGVPTLAEFGAAVLFAALVVLLTPPLVTVIAERFGLSARSAIESGLLLAQTSEISLVIGLYGLIEGQIGTPVFTIIALATLLTMVLTPFLASDPVVWRLMRIHPLRRVDDVPAPSGGGHVLLLGSGATGMPLLETLLASDHELMVIDDDAAVIARLREGNVRCIRGDASNVAVLERAHARRARVVISTIRRPRDNRRLLEYARGVPVLVRVFDERDADWIRELGGTPVLYSEAAAEETLRWFSEAFGPRVALRSDRTARGEADHD